MEEVFALKLRIKYTKTGNLRYIGHLDVMRFFQKAIRRAKLDVSYSKGFSPHQLISFAAPMPLGMTSEGEYFDGEFDSVTTSEDMKNRLNATMPEEIQVKDIIMLEDSAKPSMAIVTASDYYIYLNDEAENKAAIDKLRNSIDNFYGNDKILCLKKTKSKESVEDIKPLIYDIKTMDEGIYMLLASGSKNNLKPDAVISAMCEYMKMDYCSYDYRIHRLETYMGEPNALQPLLKTGTSF